MIPSWFFVLTIFLELFIAIVAMFTALLSYHAFKFSKNSRIFYLFFGFLLIATAMFIHLFIIFFDIYFFTKIRYPIEFITKFTTMGILIFYLFEIIGLLSICASYISQLRQVAPAIVLLLIMNPFLEIIVIAILIFIVIETLVNYQDKKNNASLMVFFAFLLLLISNLLFTASIFRELYYMVGQIVQLLAFILLMLILYKTRG